MRIAVRAWILIMLALAPRVALSDPFARGIDPIGFKLAVSPGSYLTVEGAQVGLQGTYRLALAADMGFGLMSLRLGDETIDNLLERRLDLHLLASVAVTNWAEIGIDLPLTVYQAHGFDSLEAQTGLADGHPGALGAGDIRLLGKIRLLAQGVSPVAVALIAEARLPTGDADSFLGERGFSLSPRVVAERQFGDKLRIGLEGGYRYRSEAGRYINLFVGDELTLAAAASYELPESLPWTTWTAFGEVLAATSTRAPFTVQSSDALKTPLELLLGLQAPMGRGFGLLVGGGTGIGSEPGLGRETLRLFAAVDFRGDLVRYRPTEGDMDGDGVPDELDKCPTDPGPAELDGCPDRDGDGIPDFEDRCPNQAGPATNDGCPIDNPRAYYRDAKIELRDIVQFDTGRANVRQESHPVLDEIAEILQSNPHIKRIRIDGHTDSVGRRSYNLDLSRNRARSVVEYLVSKGVAAERISYQGFGPDQPIADNKSPLGRAKNRRVEITILEME